MKAFLNSTTKWIGDTVNGPILNAAHWAAGVNTIHPSTHRLMHAGFLTMSLFGSRKAMDIVVGETPSGAKIDKKDVFFLLKPFHGKMAYNHFSDDPADKWKKAVDLWTPALVGAVGAVTGSYTFGIEHFSKIKTAMKNVEGFTLIDAEKAAGMVHSHIPRFFSGMSAPFGSSSGFSNFPGPHNVGSTLGLGFLGTVGRNMVDMRYLPKAIRTPIQMFLTGNKHATAYGPASTLENLPKYLSGNPAKGEPENLRKMLTEIFEPWFGDKFKPEHMEKMVGKLNNLRDDKFKAIAAAGTDKIKIAAATKELDVELEKVLGSKGFHNTLNELGLKAEDARIGRASVQEWAAENFGFKGQLNEVKERYIAGINARENKSIDFRKHINTDKSKGLLIGGGVVTAGLGATALAAVLDGPDWHRSDNDALYKRGGYADAASIKEDHKTAAANGVTATDAAAGKEKASTKPKKKSSSAVASFINGKPLEIVDMTTSMLNSPETYGMHRLMAALGLTGGGFVGMKAAEVLTGKTLQGAAHPVEKVPGFLKSFHKILDYKFHSDAPRDKWRYVAHFAIPAVTAAAGVIAASTNYFKDRTEKVKKAEYIDDFEDKATMAQSKPWTALTALTSLFVTPSGFSFLPLPFPNYGAALNQRFLLASGNKISLPGVGEVMTGTTSKFALGPVKLRNHLVKYAVNNPDAKPKDFEEAALGILKPWFKDVTAAQVDNFIGRIAAIRDPYLKENGVPENKKDQLEKQLNAILKGAGLEQTLREIGLDPKKATLARNGLAGGIANALGSGGEVKAIHQEFAGKYAERIKPRNPDIIPMEIAAKSQPLTDKPAHPENFVARTQGKHPDIMNFEQRVSQPRDNGLSAARIPA